jgi:hypothetical protein
MHINHIQGPTSIGLLEPGERKIERKARVSRLLSNIKSQVRQEWSGSVAGVYNAQMRYRTRIFADISLQQVDWACVH